MTGQPLLTAADVRDWPRTPRGKLICPDCGAKGWSYFDARSWIQRHREHVACNCGKVCAEGSLGHHRRYCTATA